MRSNTSRMAGSGRPTQFCTVSMSAPTRLMTEATNQRVNGTSAIAVMRWAHQCSTPSFAEPSPIARPSGERIPDAIISGDPARYPGNPGNQSQRGGRADDNPPAEIGRFEVEGVAGVPDEMTDAVAQVIKQRNGPAEQQQKSDPRTKKILDAFVGLRPGSGRHEPPDEEDCSGAQSQTGGAVEDRQHRGELPSVDLKMRRQRPVGGSHLSRFRNPPWGGRGELARVPGSVNGRSPHAPCQG